MQDCAGDEETVGGEEVKQIPLSQGLFALVDDEDYEGLAQWKWYAKKQRNSFYAVRRSVVDGKQVTVRMHRSLMPTNLKVDHKNGNGLDNQKSNLRPANNSQNAANRQNRPASGVTFCKFSGKWKAQIMIGGVNKHLGRFLSEMEARSAYAEAAPRVFGEFACVGVAL